MKRSQPERVNSQALLSSAWMAVLSESCHWNTLGINYGSAGPCNIK